MNTETLLALIHERGPGILENRVNIGVWFWELSKVPARFDELYRHYDELWVTSGFCAEAIGRAAPIPVVQLPHPLLPPNPAPGVGRAHFGLPEDATIFLCYFDFHSVVARKNPIGAIEAFRRAFGDRTDVLLLVKSMNSSLYPEEVAALRAAAQGVSVRFLDGHLDRGEKDALFACCDALVSLHRAEGLGLGMAEAMSLGKPVIATAYSGNTTFMDVGNSLLIPYELVELERDYGPYERGNVWADPDLDAAAAALRKVAESPAWAADLGRRAASDIARRLNPGVTAARISERLKARGFL